MHTESALIRNAAQVSFSRDFLNFLFSVGSWSTIGNATIFKDGSTKMAIATAPLNSPTHMTSPRE